MAKILRVKARWSGFQGAPGYSIFHFSDFADDTYVTADATAVTAKVRAFYNVWPNFLPNIVKVDVLPDVEVIEATDGSLVDVLTATTPATVTGTAGAAISFAAAVGAVVTWRTTQVRNGRRIKGRTFLVPLANNGFAADGTLDTGFITALTGAATTLRTVDANPQLTVYGRPSGPAATDGVSALVVGHSIPDMGAVLRSRRD